jgi:hypothetical protein
MIKILGQDRVKYSNGNCGERARYTRDRRETERGGRETVLLKMSDGIGNKIGCWRKYL